VLAIRQDLADKEPTLPKALMDMYAQAKEISASYYEDPNWSRLAWVRHYFEDERQALGADPWPIGLKANYKNIERFIEYSHDQGLISERYAPERLFAASALDS
jgi:4,5-dihydroxyphthalate decarboxylase